MMRRLKNALRRRRHRAKSPSRTQLQRPDQTKEDSQKDEAQKQQNGGLTSAVTVGPTPVEKASQQPAQIQKDEDRKRDEALASTSTENLTPLKNRDDRDHWQIAYDELNEDDRHVLQSSTTNTNAQPEDGLLKMEESLDEVIQITKDQYKDYQKRELKMHRSRHQNIEIRSVAQRILDSVLSFQDVINKIASFDPTGHAAGAWGVVSLGLTMAKNHIDLREALFDSSGFLADILARCAFIEETFCRTRGKPAEKEAAIVRVYTAILRYVVEVRRVQQSGTGKDVLATVTAISSQPLVTLKASIEEEDLHLKLWLLIDEHLHRKEEAERVLTGIDKMMTLIQESAMDGALSKLPVAKEACYNSFVNQHEDECLPGTRTALLQTVMEWGSTPKDKPIFWLSGMAGTGKSTISRTVTRSFVENGILGASFFFKRGESDRGSAANLFPTITRELAVHIPQLIPGIEKAIKGDPNIGSWSLREQFNKLLMHPLLDVDQEQGMTAVIVIDALDECESEGDIKIVLSLLPEVQKSTSVRLKFFLTSRPEANIALGFDQMGDYRNIILEDVDEDVVKHDITLFLGTEFSNITKKRALPSNWPGEAKIGMVADMASPLFIFAATVCRFVANSKWPPEKQLEIFLNDPALAWASKMDRTYRLILNQALTGEDESDTNQLLEEFQMTVGVIISLADPLSVNALAELLDEPVDDIASLLEYFHSVLSIPKNREMPIRAFHLSFHDYLVDQRTQENQDTSKFWVNNREKHGLILTRCLRVMSTSLRKNICNLPSDGTYRADISPDTIRQNLPPSLEYSCRYWVHHLTRCQNPRAGLYAGFIFLRIHFLPWLEAISILGRMSEAVNIVAKLHSFAKNTTDTPIVEFIADAVRFVMKNSQMADTAPLQLYYSGLVFTPQKAITGESLRSEVPPPDL